MRTRQSLTVVTLVDTHWYLHQFTKAAAAGHGQSDDGVSGTRFWGFEVGSSERTQCGYCFIASSSKITPTQDI